MIRMLHWQVMAAAWLGLLQANGPTARWVSRRMGHIEHFLRCILVIAVRKTPNRDHGPSARPDAQPASETPPDPSSDLSHRDSVSRQPRFGLSLKALGHAGRAPQAGPCAHQSPIIQHTDNKSPHDRILTRLTALEHAAQNQAQAAARMAQRLVNLGLCIQTTTCVSAPCAEFLRVRRPAPSRIAAAKPAICDTS